MTPEEAQAKAEDYVQQLGWKGPWYVISSVARQGLDALTSDIAQHLAEQKSRYKDGSFDKTPTGSDQLEPDSQPDNRG